jgi:hypothetical protein
MNNEKWYSLQEVYRNNLIPALDTVYLLRNAISSGKLKAIKTSRGSGIRYSIREDWIKKFNIDFETGKIKEI